MCLIGLQYANFVQTWSLFDPEATGFLEWHNLPPFLAELEPPMGLGKDPMPTAKDLMSLVGETDSSMQYNPADWSKTNVRSSLVCARE